MATLTFTAEQMNRLALSNRSRLEADLLFVLARVLNRANLDGLGGDDVYWKSEKLSRNLDPDVA